MDKTQRGVAAGMAVGAIAGIIGLVFSAILTPNFLGQAIALQDRLFMAALAALAPIFALTFSVARLARHRFFTPEDINGSGLVLGTDTAGLLQALIQNTLEQAVLAIPVYFCCAIVFPTPYLGAVVAGGAMFLIGRIAFYVGYRHGAPSRAFGFAFTFYPTVLLAIGAAYFIVEYNT